MISPIVRLATRLNYRFGIRSLTKAENGVEYRTYNLYESQEPMVSEILSNIGSNDVVYDIGAHQGRYCLPLAQRAKSVHAFEPHPVVFNRLKKNIKINRGMSRLRISVSEIPRVLSDVLSFIRPTTELIHSMSIMRRIAAQRLREHPLLMSKLSMIMSRSTSLQIS